MSSSSEKQLLGLPDRASQKETSSFIKMENETNFPRNAATVVLPPISVDAIRNIHANFERNTSLSGMLQSMILRSAHGSQASGSQLGSRRSSDVNACSVVDNSRRTSFIFDDEPEAMDPTLMAMANSAADLSTLSTLQGILESEMRGGPERQVEEYLS